jgi:cbb3-type cytochrome oxidase subunit 3
MARRMTWYSLGLIIIGFGGGYALREGWLSFVLYHIGGLGAVGLLACASAAMARNKGYEYWRAWLLAFLLPSFLGLIAAYLVPPGEHERRPAACGGSVSLALGLIFVAVWAFMRRRGRVTELHR